MRHVSIIVAKDQLPNLLAYAGSKRLFHLTEVEENNLPEGAGRYQAMELSGRSSTGKNRIATLTTVLQVGDTTTARFKAPIDNLEELARFLDGETLKLEHSVRQIQD